MSSVRNILTQSQSANSSSFCLFKRVSWVVVWLFRGGAESQEEESLSNEKISSVKLGKICSDTQDRIDQKLTISSCSTATLSQIQNNQSSDFTQANDEGLVHALNLSSTGYDLDDFLTQRSLYESHYGDDKISTDSGDQFDIEVDYLEEV